MLSPLRFGYFLILFHISPLCNPMKKHYRASQVWDHLSSWRTTAVNSFYPLFSAELWSQNVYTHSHFQPISPLLADIQKVSLFLTGIRIHLSPVVIKAMTFLGHTEPCRRCFGPHLLEICLELATLNSALRSLSEKFDWGTKCHCSICYFSMNTVQSNSTRTGTTNYIKRRQRRNRNSSS